MSKKVFATDAIKAGFQLFGKNWLMHILFVIGYYILSIILQALLNPGDFKAMYIIMQARTNPGMNANELAMQMNQIQGNALGRLSMLLISVLIGMYFSGYFIRHAQNRFKGFGDLFKDVFTGKKIGNYFLALILIVLAVVGLSVVFAILSFILAAATNSSFVMTIGVILFILFIFYLYARLYFALFLVLDKGAGAVDAIEQSWKQTKGNEGQIILFFILSILLAILGFILFIIGLLVMIPVIYLALSWFYVQLFDTEDAVEEII